VLKTQRIGDRRLRTWIYLADLAVAAVALAVDVFLPASLGMLKGPFLAVLFAVYYYKTWHIYQVG